MKRSTDVEIELAALDELPSDPAELTARLAAALGAKHCRVVAKGARLAEERLHYASIPALVAAYARFVDQPVKADPVCIAKKAVVRALVALDCDDAEFFRGCLACRQLEPVWGGKRDTAAEVRAAAAMGLVATGHPRALVALAGLLRDPEPEARVGAARAIACGNPHEAELLLRSKVLAGDSEPAVIGECFTGLLGVEPDESIPFVVAALQAEDESVSELAALALGESRLPEALAPLLHAWHAAVGKHAFRRALLRAVAAHRSEEALAWLLALVADERRPSSARSCA
jgi:HEAT repeat protein